MPNLKISQLPVPVDVTLNDTDSIPVARSGTTNRILGGSGIKTPILNAAQATMLSKVNSLSAKNSNTVNLSFNSGSYSLSADVIPTVLVPTGAIMSFYRSTAPTGWLICDGTTIPAQYTELISLVGANTPNLRGMFIRGWSSGTSTTSRDPLSASRTLGSLQEDAFESHNHLDAGASGTLGTYGTNAGYATTNSTYTGYTGDTETRPVNIALLYCIKT